MIYIQAISEKLLTLPVELLIVAWLFSCFRYLLACYVVGNLIYKICICTVKVMNAQTSNMNLGHRARLCFQRLIIIILDLMSFWLYILCLVIFSGISLKPFWCPWSGWQMYFFSWVCKYQNESFILQCAALTDAIFSIFFFIMWF